MAAEGPGSPETNIGALSMAFEYRIRNERQRLDSINSRYRVEENPEERGRLDYQRIQLVRKIYEMELALRRMQAEIRDEQGVKDTARDLKYYLKLYQRVDNEQLSSANIEELKRTELGTFFDEDFEQIVERARVQIRAKERINAAFGRSLSQLRLDAEAEWISHETELRATLQDDSELQAQLRELGQLGNLTSIKRAMAAELENGQGRWIRQRVDELAYNQGQHSVLTSMVNENTLFHIKEMLAEAINIEQERIYQYLEKKVEVVRSKLDEPSVKRAISNLNGAEAAYHASIDRLSTMLQQRSVTGSEGRTMVQNLEQLSKNIDKLSLKIDDDEKSMRQVLENRAAIENDIKPKAIAVQREAANFRNPSFVDRLVEGLKQEGSYDAITKRRIDQFRQLADPRNEIGAEMANNFATINNLGSLTPEELMNFVNDTEAEYAKIPPGGFRALLDKVEAPNYQALKKGHEAIMRLKGFRDPEALSQPIDNAKTLQGIEAILEQTIGIQRLSSPHRAHTERDFSDNRGEFSNNNPEKKLKLIPDDEFKNCYGGYTNGKMVYFERGGEWYILMSESFFAEDNVEAVKKQITQELLHVQFENGGTAVIEDEITGKKEEILIKDLIRKELKEDFPEQWDAIKDAFLDYVDYNGDLDSKGTNEWSDDDILSELYSLEDELGQRHIEHAWNPWDILNNELHKLKMLKRGGNDAKELARKWDANERILGAKTSGATEEGETRGEGVDQLIEIDQQDPKEAKFEDNERRILENREKLKKLKQSSDLKRIPHASTLRDKIESHNNETERINNGRNEGQVENIDQRIEREAEFIKKLEEKVVEMAKAQDAPKGGVLADVWRRTHFMSIKDFVEAGKQSVEYIKRRLARRGDDHAAKVNEAVWGGTGLGLESQARQSEIEDQEVGEWEKRYDKLPPEDILKILTKVANGFTAPDRDQIKAIIRTLAKKGRIKWQNPDIWRAVNRMQRVVYLKPGDSTLLSNPDILSSKLSDAFAAIYGRDEFPRIEAQNESTYESEKQKLHAIHDKTPTKMNARLDEIAYLIKTKQLDKVDPIVYESIIEYCIKQGKSYGENAVFHLMYGIANGILAPDRGHLLARNATNWPPIQVFDNIETSEAAYRHICKNEFGESFEKGTITGDGGDFKSWFLTKGINTHNIADRVRKSVTGRGWDPDWVRTVAFMGDAQIIKQSLSGKGGQVEAAEPAVANAIAGHLQYLEENALKPTVAKRTDFARIAGNVAMYEGVLNGTAYKNDATIFRRPNNGIVPNEAGVGRHGSENLGQHRQRLRNYLYEIDRTFFEPLTTSQELTPGQEQAMLNRLKIHVQNQYPGLFRSLGMANYTKIDQIYSNLRPITEYMVNSLSYGRYKAILKDIGDKAKAA